MIDARPLPSASEAELALLGAALIAPDRVLTETGDLAPGDFYQQPAAELWRIVLALHRDGKAVDLATLQTKLPTDNDELRAFLSEVLTSDSGTPSAASDYAAAILEAARRRDLIQLAHAINEGAHDKAADVSTIARETIRHLNASAPAPATAQIVRPLAAFQVATDPTDDTANLLGRRFLCRGGAALLVGPTGIGKSSLLMQAGITVALGRTLFGIKTAMRLSSLLIQAENDDGDVAEMRDGIYRGLNLTEAEKAEAGAAVKVVCESVATGAAFVELARQLVAEHKPDLLMIDPLFAFCGCNVSDQEKMSAFLRNGLNPLLQEHGCGLILAHHVNKPASGREKPDWKATDFAYLGSGTVELANWARAVVGLRSIGAHDVFEVVLGKRGKRAGLVTNEGEPLYSFPIKHAAAGICWELATDLDLDGEGKAKPGKPELLRLIPKVGSIGQAALLNKAGETGIGKNRCRDLLAELVEGGLVYIWRTPRPGTNDAKSYSQQPQDTGAE